MDINLKEKKKTPREILNLLFSGLFVTQEEIASIFYLDHDIFPPDFKPVYSKLAEEFLKEFIRGNYIYVQHLKILSQVPLYDALFFNAFLNRKVAACSCMVWFYKTRLTPELAGKLRAVNLDALYALQEIAGESISKDFYRYSYGYCSDCNSEETIDLKTFLAAIPQNNLLQAAKTIGTFLLLLVFEDPRSSDAVKWECVKRLSQEVCPYTLLKGEFTIPAKITALQLQKTLIYLEKCFYLKVNNLPTKEALQGLFLPLTLKGDTRLVSIAQGAWDRLNERNISGLSCKDKLIGLEQRLKENPIGFLQDIAALPESQVKEVFKFTISFVRDSEYLSEKEAEDICKNLGGLL